MKITLKCIAKMSSRILLLVTLVSCDSSLSLGPQPGLFSSGIIGGQSVLQSDPLAQVTVRIELEDNNKKSSYCSGIVISPQYILTAAHCFREASPRRLISYQGAEAEILEVLLHPQNNLQAYDNRYDLALIHIKEQADFSRIAELATETPPEKSEIWIAGYGRTELGQEGSQSLNKINQSVYMNQYTESEMVVLEKEGTGSCYGDSGGPAYLPDGDKIILVGIDSRVPRGSTSYCGKYEIYTKVSAALDWIHQYIDKD